MEDRAELVRKSAMDRLQAIAEFHVMAEGA